MPRSRSGSAKFIDAQRRPLSRRPHDSDPYSELVYDVGDTWREPSRPLSLVAFSPGPNLTTQRDVRAARIYRDVLSIDVCDSAESVFNAAFDVFRLDFRCDGNRIDHAGHSVEASHSVFGCFSLILPLHLPFEGNPALLNDGLDVLPGRRKFEFQCRDSRTRDLRIRRRPSELSDLNIVGHRGDSRDAFDGDLGLDLLVEAADIAGQGDFTAIHFDCNVGVIHFRAPFELGFHVSLDVGIGFHVGILHNLGYRSSIMRQALPWCDPRMYVLLWR